MRIKIGTDCNVVTDEHSNAYQTPARGPAPEITIPSLRARMSIREAEVLARDLAAAVAVAKKEQAVSRSKAEILSDIASGRVPATVATFGELHDYVDANEYGGACEGPDDADIDIDFWNDVQDAVHNWLIQGRPEQPLSDKKFKRLLTRVKTGELKLSDIEVPPPTREDSSK